jgi:hypothetical protein
MIGVEDLVAVALLGLVAGWTLCAWLDRVELRQLREMLASRERLDRVLEELKTERMVIDSVRRHATRGTGRVSPWTISNN